jgi:hypothetical protein
MFPFSIYEFNYLHRNLTLIHTIDLRKYCICVENPGAYQPLEVIPGFEMIVKSQQHQLAVDLFHVTISLIISYLRLS